MNIRMPAYNKQSGFTLLEIVIAISLIVILTTLLLTAFGPWMRFKQRLDTESRLKDLAQAATALYRYNAYSVDNTDLAGTIHATYGAIQINATEVLETNCPMLASASSDPSEIDTNGVLSNLLPMQPYASSSMATLARDGFNNAICVFVSKRNSRGVAGAQLYYHTIAFVSLGENATLDSGTKFELEAASNTWVLRLGGDDRGVMVDGFQLANDNYKLTMDRLQKLTKAYETYFNVRYLSRSDRDITIDYFYYYDNNNNNGEPGTPVLPIPASIPPTRTTLGATWVPTSFDNVVDQVSGTNIGVALGISVSDGYDAWGQKIIIDNRSSRVRSGANSLGNKNLPPYTAVVGALLPGTATACNGLSPASPTTMCPTFISSTAVGTY